MEQQRQNIVELGEVLHYEQPTKYIVGSVNYNDNNTTPVLTAGKSFILGYTNEKSGVFPKEKLPAIIFDDFTTAIKFVDFPFKVKSSAMKILHADKSKANPKFLFYIMQTIVFPVRKHKRHWISEYSKIKIPLPSLAEQKYTTDKLDKVFVEVEKGQKRISANSKETERFRQSLLQKTYSNPKWQNVKLGDYFDIAWGNTSITKKSYVSTGYTAYSAAGADGSLGHYEHDGGGIILSAIGARCGKCFLADGKWTAIKNTIAIISKQDQLVDYRYAWYFLNNEDKWHSKGAGQPFITQKRAINMEIPVPLKNGKPDIAEQKRVADELDRAFASSAQLGNLFDEQKTLFISLRASVLNQSFQMQT